MSIDPADPMSVRPAPRVVVLDIGEVLVDETRVWTTWAPILGVSPATLMATLGAAIVQGGDHVDAFDHLAPNVTWRELEDEHERHYGGFVEADLYPDVRASLAAMVADGLRVAIAGNQPVRRREQLAALGLPAEELIVSDEVGVSKPDPAFFALVVARLGVTASEVLYVGDRVDNDMVPALEAGMATCWLRRGPWGRLQDLPDGLEVDIELEGLGELPMLLAAWRDADDGQGEDGEDGR
jgi:HAD superfamily hydrolase (TIGR01549 family)